MGHESQIEPWSPKLTTFGFVGFGTDRLRCEEAMKTADSEKPKPRGRLAPQPSTWRGRSEQISLDQVGCEARKSPAEADVFFLDFSFYRTYQDLDWQESGCHMLLHACVYKLVRYTCPHYDENSDSIVNVPLPLRPQPLSSPAVDSNYRVVHRRNGYGEAGYRRIEKCPSSAGQGERGLG